MVINTIQPPLRNVLPARARLGEGPLWRTDEQQLYWIDTHNHRVHQFQPSTAKHRFFEVGDVVGCVAPAGVDRLIMAQRDRLAFLDTHSGAVTPLISVEHAQPNMRFNDGKCDAAGRLWVGSLCPTAPVAQLYRYDPDGSLHILEEGLAISNGLGWSPDQQTFYLADSRLQVIYAYTFDLDSGSLGDRQVFVDLTAEVFSPDGLTIDQDGCIWAAMWDGWCVIQFDPSGKEMRRIQLPVQRPTCCTFGDPDRAMLYITTASVGLSEAEIEQSFYSGDLFCLPTTTVGSPTYSFGEKI